MLTPGDLEKARACARAHRAAATHAPCAAARQRPGGEGGCSTRSGSGPRAAGGPQPSLPPPHPTRQPTSPAPPASPLTLTLTPTLTLTRLSWVSPTRTLAPRSSAPARYATTAGSAAAATLRCRGHAASRPAASADRRPSDRRPSDRRPPDRRPPDEGFPQPPPVWRQLPASCLPACRLPAGADGRSRHLPPSCRGQLPRPAATARCLRQVPRLDAAAEPAVQQHRAGVRLTLTLT